MTSFYFRGLHWAFLWGYKHESQYRHNTVIGTWLQILLIYTIRDMLWTTAIYLITMKPKRAGPWTDMWTESTPPVYESSYTTDEACFFLDRLRWGVDSPCMKAKIDHSKKDVARYHRIYRMINCFSGDVCYVRFMEGKATKPFTRFLHHASSNNLSTPSSQQCLEL